MKILILVVMLLMFGMAYAGSYIVDENMDMYENNIINATNITAERFVFENDVTHHMRDNTTCVIITAGTTTLNICE